jgi:broad-specificity NMP kinase
MMERAKDGGGNTAIMKVVLLGLSGTGKTTMGNVLKGTYGFPVVEADDEVHRQYNGLWPDQEALIDCSFETTNRRILEMQHVFFITSWLEKDTIAAFSAHGFCLLLLIAPLEELLRRRKQRDGEYPPALLKRVRHNYRAFLEIVQAPAISKLFALTLDMSSTTTQEAISLIRNLIQIG